MHPARSTRNRRSPLGPILGTLALSALIPTLPGCRLPWAGIGNQAQVASVENAVVLEPALETRVYVSSGANAADVFLTDIPPARLAPDRPLTGVSGQILHLHMFVEPYPGRTPIERSAISASVRLIVAAEGEVGVYTGAGFLLPDDSPGGRTFSGSLKGGSLRLAAKTPGFVDRLGPSRLDLSFVARRDAETATVVERAAEDFVWRATAFEQPEDPAPASIPPAAETLPEEPDRR